MRVRRVAAALLYAFCADHRRKRAVGCKPAMIQASAAV